MSRNGSPSAGPAARCNLVGFSQAPPFIVTAQMPPDIMAWADNLRRMHFPPERNHLAAHVTLFHSFAPSLFGELKRVLPRMAREYAPPAARLDGLMNLGSGTAIAVASPAMLAIWARIAEYFHGALTAQDQHPPRLHITIQNKVTREEAVALQHSLENAITPRKFSFTGLELFIYRGGPWERVGQWPFRGKERG